MSDNPSSAPSGEPQVRQVNKRGAARLAAVQALYQMDVAGTGVLEIAAEYEAFRLGKEVDGNQYRDADAQWYEDWSMFNFPRILQPVETLLQ